MTTDQIIWQEIGPNDFKAQVGNSLLRVEKMGAKSYWWCVYNDFDENIGDVWDTGNWPTSESEAKQTAEQAYKKYIEENGTIN